MKFKDDASRAQLCTSSTDKVMQSDTTDLQSAIDTDFDSDEDFEGNSVISDVTNSLKIKALPSDIANNNENHVNHGISKASNPYVNLEEEFDDLEIDIVENYFSSDSDVIGISNDVIPSETIRKYSQVTNEERNSNSTDEREQANTDITDGILLENDIVQEVLGESAFDETPEDDSRREFSEEDNRVQSFLTSPNDVTVNVPLLFSSTARAQFAALTMNLSFAGCGFLGIYHLGVAHSLAHHGQKLLLNVQKFGGASAGSLIASALAIKGPDKQVIDECIDFYYGLAETVRGKRFGVLTPRMSLLEPLRHFLDSMLPEDAHIIAKNKLFISVTDTRTRRNHLFSDFETKEQLIKYLLGSSYVPFVTGTAPVKIGDKKYMDGGMTDNLPELPGGRTILISPFSGRQHICPKDKSGHGRFVQIKGEYFQVTVDNLKRGLHAFSPPKRKYLDRYFKRGQDDCIRFLKKESFFEHDEVVSVPNVDRRDVTIADDVLLRDSRDDVISDGSLSQANTADTEVDIHESAVPLDIKNNAQTQSAVPLDMKNNGQTQC